MNATSKGGEREVMRASELSSVVSGLGVPVPSQARCSRPAFLAPAFDLRQPAPPLHPWTLIMYVHSTHYAPSVTGA
jgi:hypothetical protein